MEKRHRQDNLEEYLNIAEERIITHEAMKQLAECNIKALLQKNL